MASSTSSSGYSAALSGLRMSGSSLLSGLDTESIVKQMASGTKSKINKQQQALDLLTWKQDSYRSIITKTSTFKNTYFNSLTPKTNLASNSLMGAYKAVSSNPNVTATAASNASVTSYKITDFTRAVTAAVTSDFGGGAISEGLKLNFTAGTSGTTHTVKVTLDGAAKEVTFDAASLQDFVDKTNAAFGTDKFKMDGSVLKYDAGDTVSHTFTVLPSGNTNTKTEVKYAALNALGIPDGGSNKISLSSTLGSIPFTGDALEGGSFTFNINGKDFSFDRSSTIREIINSVNNSNADVKMSFDSLAQKFSITSTTEGNGGSIKITQSSGNLLNKMFGKPVIGKDAAGADVFGEFTKGGSIGTSILMSKSLTSAPLTNTNMNAYRDSTFKVIVNGVEKTIGLYTYDQNGIRNDFEDKTASNGKVTPGVTKAIAALNIELQREFGSNAPSFTYDEVSKQVALTANTRGDVVSVKPDSDSSGSTALINALGFSGNKTNEITADTKLADVPALKDMTLAGTITIGSKTITLSADSKIQDLIDAGLTLSKRDPSNPNSLSKGVLYTSEAISATDDSAKKVLSALFGMDYAEVESQSSTLPTTSTTVSSSGKNAEVTINGVKISNASDVVVVDGTSINLGGLTQADIDAISDTNPITITTSRDTSAVKDVVVKFVDEYNKLIADLNTEISTKRPKYDSKTTYEPLTDEQREEMSDEQEKNWEEKAKTGLLYNDQTVSDFLSKLRSAMGTMTTGKFSLSNMGIKVSSDYKDNGKLVLDEVALDKALSEHADDIQELFTKADTGLAAQVTNALDSAISTSRSTGYGSLVRKAGVANTVSGTDNEMSTQITQYQTTISNLQKRYKSEMERYWSRFTALETTMAKYSSYSSMFTSST